MSVASCPVIVGYFDEHPLFKSDESNKMQPDKGVQQSYKDTASKSANVMFRAKVKGETHLDPDIPLHMTVKTFDKPDEMPIDHIKQRAEELDIQRPDPKSLKYEPIMFTSPRNGNTYYMLKIHGTHPSIQALNETYHGQGVTHDKFMAHITINKDLYEKIKTEGINHDEVQFSPLMIERGPGNVTHLFQDGMSHTDHESDIVPKYNKPEEKLAASENDYSDLQKGVKEAIMGMAAAATIATGSPANTEPINHQPKAGSHQIEPSKPGMKYDRNTMLRTIASVESSNGINTKHAELTGSMHSGERAFGKYGLTPVVIRETIKMNKDLKSQYGKAAKLKGQDMQHFMQDNPHLEDQIAQAHVARLEHHFGGSPSHIGYAWLNGVSGTYKAKRANTDIENHWHVKKIKDAYSHNSRGYAKN